MEQLADKIALVTGGGSGINLAFVKLLHNAGVKVLIADIGLHADAKKWLATLESDKPIFQQTDVTDWKQLERAFTVCRETFGDVPDIVVPGAGIYEPNTNTFWDDVDSDEGSRYKVLDVNLVHPIKASRLAIRNMVEAGKGGAIVHTSSIAAQRSSIVTPLYTASKHGISSFVRGMAPLQELSGIRVVGVAPGVVGSPLYTDHPETMKFLDLSKDFLLPPEEIAKAMFALLTDARYKAGTILEVCDIGNWREVELLNDSGPRGPASTTSNKAEAIKGVLPHLSKDGKYDGSKKVATD
ncbi:NAD-dependent 15-hydroxyprostaglandin dehydrogenase [Exophiala viscosa]|uniref:NAD-dependent 15-hydroxyprostaglandin dehydrogenase n=1 Tax=Exophiala viscosa TaxID=2486360 RepID=A0AAN6E346_9EURO|nr:NAD-dependent 15-hydroxyprostaglandin dehydrogenase [Exophiala viscosa]KAI1630198.1 NAD-dependent 15-hydroxyprostaglandin dehydrogenase [Exophiala viscosa]